MKHDNRGLSLVELMVAFAVMAVLGSMLVMGFGIVPRTAAKSCANGLKTIIGQTRIQTMGKKETVLELQHDSADGKYYTVIRTDDGQGHVAVSDRELCGKSTVKVSYRLVDSSGASGGFVDLGEGETWAISFDRSNGKEVKGGLAGADTLCDAIQVQGGTKTYLIRIYPATGKVTLE